MKTPSIRALVVCPLLVACGGEGRVAPAPATEPIGSAPAPSLSVAPPPAIDAPPPTSGTPPSAGEAPRPIEMSFAKKWLVEPLAKPVYESQGRRAETCADLPKVKPPKTTLEAQPFVHAKLRCASFKMFEEAKDAKKSLLQGLALDEKALDALPSEIGATVGVKLPPKKSWSNAAPKATAKLEGERLRVDDGPTTYTVAMVGRGDVDGDGTEDWVIEVVGGPRQGTLATTHAYAIGRTTEQGILKVVRAAP